MKSKNFLHHPLARQTVIAGACFLAACATPDPAQARKPVFLEIPGVTSAAPETASTAGSTALSAVLLADASTSAASPAAEVAATSPAPPVVPKTLYSFKAEELELKTALAQFARANNLNIIPDRDVAGMVTMDVHDLPLEQMMRALLEASDCSWSSEGDLIRIRNTETQTFTVDYLRLIRKGVGRSSATLSSATFAGGSGGGSSGGGTSGGGGGSAGSSSIDLSADNSIPFWSDLKEELDIMLTEKGRSALAINKTAGLIQVTDRPSALKRVQNYLSSVDTTVHRQVDIEVKLYDVTLNDQFQFGIDWMHVAEAYSGTLGIGGATLPVAVGGSSLKDSALGSLTRLVGGGGGNPVSLVFSNFNTQAAVNALKQQGNVEIISKPRLRTLNNQTALIKVGSEQPFFAVNTTTSQSSSGNIVSTGDQITTVTIGTILSITPQISADNWISLDISPVLTSLIDTLTSPSKSANAPVLDTKQASTLVRVRDGDTVVMGGLIQTQHSKSENKIPVLGDIPWLGKLFTGTFNSKQKKELVMFVSPHIIREGQEPPLPLTPAEEEWKIIKHAKK